MSHKIELSVPLTIIGVLLLFAGAVVITLIAPRFVDPMWTEPTNYYQVQMYRVADPRIFASQRGAGADAVQYVYHLKEGESLLAFVETETVRFVTAPDLEKYITQKDEKELKLTSKVLMLRRPKGEMVKKGEVLHERLRQEGENIDHQILELYAPKEKEAFALAETDGVWEGFVDKDFTIFADGGRQPYFDDPGVVYIKNPKEYRVSKYQRGGFFGWRYDPDGEPIPSLEALRSDPYGFRSRKELIEMGENIYAYEGCSVCHTDQTRTLVQDVVLNGSAEYPAPPSSPNEYVFQYTTFPGTKRNGPDLSRTGIKRPSADWHKSHFWNPRNESPGSIMPSFRHFFDDDPSGTDRIEAGVPSMRFEAIYQYLMTKGTRIFPPTEAWWQGKDPIHTLQIIDGEKSLAQ